MDHADNAPVIRPLPQTHGNSADEYFQEVPQRTGLAQQPQYGQQQHYQPPLTQQQYPPQPLTYSPEPVTGANGNKVNFNQTFRVVNPRYNDIWAAILFLATFIGFVIVSAFAIQGYSATKLFQGDSIYEGAISFGLSTNTIILL
jgi:uncharacterized membrane protein (DUF485 family)